MVPLKQSLQDWQTEAFESSLKAELLALDPALLPLQKGVSCGGYVDGTNMQMTLLSTAATADRITAKVGVFFNEIIAGCSCGDDPMSEPAYCELCVLIDKQTGMASFSLC